MSEGRVVQLSTQGCRTDPYFSLISYPGRVTVSRGVTVALGKFQQSPLHPANKHPHYTHRSKPKAKDWG